MIFLLLDRSGFKTLPSGLIFVLRQGVQIFNSIYISGCAPCLVLILYKIECSIATYVFSNTYNAKKSYFAVFLQIPARGDVAGQAAAIAFLFGIGDDDFAEIDADALGWEFFAAAVGGHIANDAIGQFINEWLLSTRRVCCPRSRLRCRRF